METSASSKETVLRELSSPKPSVWQQAIICCAVSEGQIPLDEVTLRVSFYTGGRFQ